MKNLANPLHIKIVGTLVGEIWMPQTFATMEFKIDVTTERNRYTDQSLSISEAIERHLAYNTGDFRYALIATGYVILEAWNSNAKKKVTRYIDLKDCPSIAESMAGAKEMDAFESIQWQGHD